MPVITTAEAAATRSTFLPILPLSLWASLVAIVILALVRLWWLATGGQRSSWSALSKAHARQPLREVSLGQGQASLGKRASRIRAIILLVSAGAAVGATAAGVGNKNKSGCKKNSNSSSMGGDEEKGGHHPSGARSRGVSTTSASSASDSAQLPRQQQRWNGFSRTHDDAGLPAEQAFTSTQLVVGGQKSMDNDNNLGSSSTEVLVRRASGQQMTPTIASFTGRHTIADDQHILYGPSYSNATAGMRNLSKQQPVSGRDLTRTGSASQGHRNAQKTPGEPISSRGTTNMQTNSNGFQVSNDRSNSGSSGDGGMMAAGSMPIPTSSVPANQRDWTSTTIMTSSPASYPSTSPMLPPPPLTLDYAAAPFDPSMIMFPGSGEVIDGGVRIVPAAVLGHAHQHHHEKVQESAADWKRHTRVYGGGVCLACAAAEDGGFYGPRVRPEDRRHTT